MHAKSAAADDLAGWIPQWREAEHRKAKEQAEREGRERAQVAADLAKSQQRNAARRVGPDDSMASIRELARKRAALMLDRITELAEPVTRDFLQSEVQALEARGLPEYVAGLEVAEQLAGMVKRATCAHWWRRQLNRAATLKREQREQAAGRVSRAARSPYVTNETAQRHAKQQQRNAETLERTHIESAEGELLTLAQAAAASTANRAIRRGELMTRIKGAETWATARGMVGEFATLTAPSRFHSTGFGGKPNKRWDGSTPKAAQLWLCGMWAKVRAKLARDGIRIFGFRIAEPHHDGCPHWHALWWADSAQADAIRAAVARYWLSEDGTEPGALEHRAKFERIDQSKGGACAYLAKYIAKNIDDCGAVGTEGHTDDWAGQGSIEGTEGQRAAARVAAWASAHGIRQFQAIGQPPVGVWRELRRLPKTASGEDSQAMRAALQAVNRTDTARACWAGYLGAQGGAMLPRKAYRIRLAKETEQRPGVYGLTMAARPVGVALAARPAWVYRSERKTWKPRGTWTDADREATHGAWGAMARAFNRAQGASLWKIGTGFASVASPEGAAAWTRVNNCTQEPQIKSLRDAQAGFPEHQNERPGGHPQTWKPPKWTTEPPTPSRPTLQAFQLPPVLPDSCLRAFAAAWKVPQPSQ